MPNTKLTLDDIAEPRTYERERDEFRRRIIALKKRRRISLGPHITLMFENRDTVRFQIQEMARVERIFTDEGILTELDIYNPLIPEAGQLSATLFVELTSDEQLREWLPKLVGIERSVDLVIGDSERVSCRPDDDHESQLTREEVTSSVHYVSWQLTPAQVEAFASQPLRLEVSHPAYQHGAELSDENRAELLTDLQGG